MFRITNGTILRGQQAKVYKWFNGASPYSQYCDGLRRHNTDCMD